MAKTDIIFSYAKKKNKKKQNTETKQNTGQSVSRKNLYSFQFME